MVWVSTQGRSAEPHYGAVWEADGHTKPGNYRSADLAWRDDWLYAKRRKFVRIVRDQDLWRVELPDGKFTGTMNRTRAKDAAMSWGLRILNGGFVWPG